MNEYEEYGLKIGLEIHVQLDTSSKLFCNCSTKLVEEHDDVFERELRPARSELREVDVAALFEWKRGRRFEYLSTRGAACLVEADEEPPHEINREALLIAIAVAKALNMFIPDRLYVMRKIVIDGSNTSGFQRTLLVGLNGYILDDGDKIGVQTVCLEEDAARKIAEEPERVKYKLDRLGIPLIEISTAPDIKTPEQAYRVAYKIGQLVRLTKKAKRGLGTIRQDLNVSIKEGAVVEVKGVQHISLIPKVVEYEFLRQRRLLEIRDELKRRGLDPSFVNKKIHDVTDVFKNTQCKLITRVLGRKGYGVFALVLPGFKGILGLEIQPGRRFGTELSDYAKVWGGVGGIIHTDELPSYGITEKEVEELYWRLNADKDRDCIVLIIDERNKAEKAFEAIVERVRYAFTGVPNETRGANDDGTTRYLRPRPGSARMYPETDIPVINVTDDLITEADVFKPEPYEVKLERFMKKYGLNVSQAKQVLEDLRLDLFEKLIEKYGGKIQASIIASTITLASSLDPFENIDDEKIEKIIEYVVNGRIAKEAIQSILETLSKTPDKTVEKIIEELGLETISFEKLQSIVDEIVRNNLSSIKAKPDKAFNIVMGEVMKIVRGRIDGRVVAETVKRKLEELKL